MYVFSSPSSFERVEVPLHIVPSYSISPACLGPLVDLPKILLQEEDEAYASVSGEERQDLITRVHNASGEGTTQITPAEAFSKIQFT